MESAAMVLGIDMMDSDHQRIENMLATAPQTADADLPGLHRAVCAELAAHFAREETLMRENDFPGLHCHVSQHSFILAEMARDSLTREAADLRRKLEVAIPQLIQSHVSTMDRMAAAFLKGDLARSDFDILRLPLSGALP